MALATKGPASIHKGDILMTRFAAIALAAVATLSATTAQAAVVEVKGGTASASIATFGAFEQSFKPTENLLTSFAFTFGSTSRTTSTGSVVFSLLDQNNTVLVQGQTTSLTGLVFRSLGDFVTVFTGSVAVTANQTYRAVLTSDTSNVVLGYRNGTDGYADGALTRATDSDQACIRSPNPCDANFRFTTAAAAVVPEPGSWALMLTGFALVGGAARYRRRASVLRYS